MHRVVGAVVAELQLVGLAAEREARGSGGRGRCRTPACRSRTARASPRRRSRPPPDRRGRSTGRCRRRRARARRAPGVVAGTTVTRQPTSRSWRRMFALDAEVVGDDVERDRRRRRRRGRRRRRARSARSTRSARAQVTSRHEVAAVQRRRARARARAPRRDSATCGVIAPRCAPAIAERAGERAGVDAGDAGDAAAWPASACSEPVGAPVRRPAATARARRSRRTHGRARLEVLGLTPTLPISGAVITTICPRYDGSVSDLLVAGDRRVEDDLADRLDRARRSRSRGRRCRPPATSAAGQRRRRRGSRQRSPSRS